MESPSTWQWIWLGAAALFVLGEMATAGAFFLLPFGVGAGVAAVLAFADVSVGWEWGAFVGVSAAAFAAMRPLARRLDRQDMTPGVGASRWAGRVGTVIGAVPGDPGASGLVRVDREEWRAESADGAAIEEGARVRVVAVEGTRVVVERVETGE